MLLRSFVLAWLLLQSVQDIYKSANDDFEAGRWADAAAKYEQVLNEDAKHIPSQFNLAVCRTRLGKSEEAAKNYAKALESVTNDSERRFLERRMRELRAMRA